MKTSKTKEKIQKKIGKTKEAVARKCAKAAKAVAFAVAVASVFGCSTVDQPNSAPSMQAGKSETMHATLNNSPIFVFIGAKRVNLADPTNGVEFAESDSNAITPDITILGQAQSLESSGTETYSPSNSPSNTPTATPTNDIKPTTTATWNQGLCSDTAHGNDWIAQITSASCTGLAEWLRSGNADGQMVVTKKDGSTEAVTCKDGKCTTASGDCITCKDTEN